MNKDFVKDPESSKEKLITLVKDNMSKLDQVYKRGVQKDEGLEQYVGDLYESMTPCLTQEVVICIFTMLPLVQELDKQRREGKTEEIRQEYDALCSGYEGDELMEVNIDMLRLARMLPVSIWNEYDYDSFHQLAARIQENLGGTKSDLPLDFLDEWSRFLDKHGYDGQDQLFVSSARYIDSPEILLAKLRHNVGDGIKDPAVAQRENLERRRKVMALHEERARKVRWYKPFTLSSIQERNAVLEHLMWIRNSWKIHISRIVGMVRQAMLCIEKEFIENGRLEQPGDIFHLDVEEIDKVLLGEEALDLMDLVRPRKAIYGRAVRSNLCPMLVDSRCRILKPDVKTNQEPGTLVGSPVSPGVAIGRVRIAHRSTDPLEQGEVLVATVTDPTWTPMFVGCSGVILQIGGVLQHGALCAREFGKPAVSGIDVMTSLKTGMMVSVDGNTGVVKILDEGDAIRGPSVPECTM